MLKQPVDTLEPANESRMQQTQRTICGCCSLRTGTLTTGIVCLLLSTSTLLTYGILYYIIKKPEFSLDVNSVLENVAALIASILCIHGAAKENRYSLLPWLVVFAIDITINFLTGFYFILYGRFEITMVGVIVLMVCALFTYLWICVANYYSELRDRENNTGTVLSSPTRSYLHPSAVTNPAAFSVQPPPAYNVAVTVRSPAHDEKPPCYEEAEKERAEREQQQRQLV